MTLAVRNISRQFDPPAGVRVLDGVSFDATPGETIAIVGPSGSGKSTLLNIIGTLDKPTSGSVLVDGADVTVLQGNAAAAYRASKIGFVFQDHHLLPQLSAVENVLLPSLALRGKKDADRAAMLLETVGVAARKEAFPGQLSGGERQRVAVARALMNAPGILLCDEPTGNLDHDNALKIVELFTELARQQSVTILMVTHNLELAGKLRRTMRLASGHLEAAAGAGGKGVGV
jgi:lipoprotein-releasing system ATP-binding protein